MNWHLEVIAAKLTAVREGKIRRLIINLPPRHVKSRADGPRYLAPAINTTLPRRWASIRTVSRWSSGQDEPLPGVWLDLLGIMWERAGSLAH
jgi:hypothetical protein